MHHEILLVLALLFGVCLLVMLAQKIKVAYPIFLVIAGLIITLIPGMPMIELKPELVFLIFLPPLLYEAAWYTSWNDFWKWRRPIILLAFGLVFFTSIIVAYFAQSMIPGFTLALGFLLGGIVSPPDAIAATTVLKGIKVPKRIPTILEGESLINDASSLIVFRFALAAILTGTFSLQQASGQFLLVAGMGIVVGLVGGFIMYLIHKHLPTTPAIDAALTFLTPYLLYLSAEQFHFSGVMAVVTGGLLISYRSHEAFKNGNTRLNMLGMWNTLIFLMNALVFILIGLSLPSIVKDLGDQSIIQGIKYGLIISLIVIIVRFIWVYPSAHIPRWLSKSARRESSPGWKGPFLVSLAGMRGVVSLATALSIPLTLSDGTAFPHRSMIILVSFVVIFVTLVGQGLLLPFIVKKLKLPNYDEVLPEDEQRAQIKIRLFRLAISTLQQDYKTEITQFELFKNYLSQLEYKTNSLENRLDILEYKACTMYEKERYNVALTNIYERQRKEIYKMRRERYYDDEQIRHAEMQIDLDESKLQGGLHH